jgi:hypothetical protein
VAVEWRVGHLLLAAVEFHRLHRVEVPGCLANQSEVHRVVLRADLRAAHTVVRVGRLAVLHPLEVLMVDRGEVRLADLRADLRAAHTVVRVGRLAVPHPSVALRVALLVQEVGRHPSVVDPEMLQMRRLAGQKKAGRAAVRVVLHPLVAVRVVLHPSQASRADPAARHPSQASRAVPEERRQAG